MSDVIRQVIIFACTMWCGANVIRDIRGISECLLKSI